jgi:hypothetical protein
VQGHVDGDLLLLAVHLDDQLVALLADHHVLVGLLDFNQHAVRRGGEGFEDLPGDPDMLEGLVRNL